MVYKNKFIKINPYSRPGIKLNGVRKLVLHYTANHGATAENHFSYFNNLKGRYASAHIFVDKNEALCIVPLNEITYQANDGTFRGVPELRPNANFLSIGVEMCQERDGSIHSNTISRTEDVFVELCKKYKLDPIKDIVRHYDITRKNCPAPWVADGKKFTDFKNRVKAKLNGKPTNSQTPSKPVASKPSTPSASTGGSVVDWMNANGMDSSFANRAKLADQYGIKNYKGTADQNVNLLNKLKNVAKKEPSKTQSKPVQTKPSAPKGDMKTTSIVTYLNSINANSSFSNRAKLYKQYGLKGVYLGTAKQNLDLLAKMRGGNAPTASKPKAPTFKVGSKVKIKSSAKKYATGENIPSSVKNKTYTIQQVKSDRVLLKEIYSWVKKTDVQ